MYAKEGKIFYSTILFSVTWTASLRRASMSSSLESPAASIVAFRSSLSHLKVQTEAQHHSENLRFLGNIRSTTHDPRTLKRLKKSSPSFSKPAPTTSLSWTSLQRLCSEIPGGYSWRQPRRKEGTKLGLCTTLEPSSSVNCLADKPRRRVVAVIYHLLMFGCQVTQRPFPQL